MAHLRIGAALAAALLSTSANAAIVTFGGLAGSNGDPFSGPYLESGFSVSTIGGQVFEGHIFGNPQPSLVVGSVFNGGPNGSIQVVQTGGGAFSLSSFDLSAQNGVANYTVEGFLGAASVFSFGGAAGRGFSTYAGAAGSIDRLVFSLNPTGSSVNIDNINLSGAVPEPLTWALLIVGFGFIGCSMRAKSARVQFA